ncbi:TetR/AcrR family transcriptional regulator [Nocardia sp. NPDC003963]
MNNPREALLERAVEWFTEHGVGDTSLRTIADGIDTSHRMLHYHFGSREGLLTAVVTATWGQQYRALAELLESPIDPYTAAYELWDRMADQAARLGPLFFEVAAAAMQGKSWAAPLGQWVMEWKTVLETLFIRVGRSRDRATLLARMTLAMARGLLFELAITKGEGRAAADTAIHTFLESTRSE